MRQSAQKPVHPFLGREGVGHKPIAPHLVILGFILAHPLYPLNLNIRKLYVSGVCLIVHRKIGQIGNLSNLKIISRQGKPACFFD
jgi:hypothetical protein